MTQFEFQGKQYIPVKDSVMGLVEGCKKCAFYSNPQQCRDVDSDRTWDEQCASRNVHYEEVK